MSRESRVLVISPQKSGTHLIARVMQALGYRLYGAALRIEPEERPQFTRAERLDIARQALPVDAYQLVRDLDDKSSFEAATDLAWETLGWIWQTRLGLPVEERYGQAHGQWIDEARQLSTQEKARFCDTPSRLCWVLHELELDRVDPHFLKEWQATASPSIIFNYRDPRDALLSCVNYLSGGTGRGFGCYLNYKKFAERLSALHSLDERLSYALMDTSFPCHGDLRRARWMLRYPQICKVSFEELVGSKGGGDSTRQRMALERICSHLSIDVDESTLTDLASNVFSSSAFTFYRGVQGAWRDAYRPHHIRVYNSVFDGIEKLYGYE